MDVQPNRSIQGIPNYLASESITLLLVSSLEYIKQKSVLYSIVVKLLN